MECGLSKRVVTEVVNNGASTAGVVGLKSCMTCCVERSTICPCRRAYLRALSCAGVPIVSRFEVGTIRTGFATVASCTSADVAGVCVLVSVTTITGGVVRVSVFAKTVGGSDVTAEVTGVLVFMDTLGISNGTADVAGVSMIANTDGVSCVSAAVFVDISDTSAGIVSTFIGMRGGVFLASSLTPRIEM